MKTRTYFTIFLAALLGGLISIFGYTKFFDRKQKEIIYEQVYQPAKFASYSGSELQPVDLTYAAEKTVHAVVHVRTKSKAETTYTNPLYEFFFGENPNKVQPVLGFGSGVIISSDGYIVTNHHVIKGADDISVKLNDNREFGAKLIGDDPSTDLALIKIDAKDLPFITFGSSDDLKLGEWVLAVGNPFNLTSTVTAGIISAKARNLNILDNNYKIESYIQTDAAMNPGNSGGALVNIRGELVGINSAIISPSGGYAGNSFAIPSSIVKKVVDDLREYGVVQRAVLGVTITDVNAEIAKQNNLDKVSGIYVNEVKNGGAAQEAGMKSGDVIIKLNNVEVGNTSELQEQIGKYRPNDKVLVGVLRDGKEKDFEAVLKNLNGNVQIVKATDTYSVMGAKFSEVSSDEKQKLGIKYGVKISDLGPGKFSSAGIEEGFIITRMNNKPVNSIKDLQSIIDNTKGGVYIEGIYPNGVIAYYAFGI
jgi:Do/DeqQ family serine protease